MVKRISDKMVASRNLVMNLSSVAVLGYQKKKLLGTKLRQKAISYLIKHPRLLRFLLVTREKIRNGLYRCLFFFRHRRMIKIYLETHRIRKLQIGSGKNILKGWLNTDIHSNKDIVYLDGTKKFPFPDCTFDYVFSEHFVEHIEYQDCVRFVKECYQVLKAGGKIRISTPDFRFLIELYTDNKTDLQKRYIAWRVKNFQIIRNYQDAFFINQFFRGDHRFIYDYKALKDILEKCGFCNITRCTPEKSTDKNLRGIEQHSHFIPGEFNKLESMVIEGRKPVNKR